MYNSKSIIHNNNGGIYMLKNEKIKCDVDTCKHYKDQCCMLKEITVGCSCTDPECKDETICKNFECACKDKKK